MQQERAHQEAYSKDRLPDQGGRQVHALTLMTGPGIQVMSQVQTSQGELAL